MFKPRREEWLPVLSALLVMVALHVLVIARHFDSFSKTGPEQSSNLIKKFVVSGFDAITYAIVTKWDVTYNVYRHPLLAFMVWPFSMLDKWLLDLTGLNLVQVIVALPLLFCAFYTFIFMFRIFRDVIRTSRFDAATLSVMTFAYAYVMLSTLVPDHFCVSMFLLVFTLYVSGVKIRRGSRFKWWQTVLLFFVTAGVTLSNGIKIFIYALFTNGLRFFHPKFILPAVLLPSALIWGFARWEYRKFVLPKEKERREQRAMKNIENRQRMYLAFRDTTSLTDSLEITKAFNAEMSRRAKAKYASDHQKPWNKHTGKPLAKGEFMNWTDGTTSRLETTVENLFGESIQLHDKYLLEDTLRSRPVIVRYSWIANYVVEAAIVVLFLCGVWLGRRSRFLWMALGGMAFDMLLHLGLGFGINEVYIMGAHWLFVLPIAMAYVVKSVEFTRHAIWLRSLLVALTAWLLLYNGCLLTGYFLN